MREQPSKRGSSMGIKFKVGMSDLLDDRRALEELRRRPAGAGQKKRDTPVLGWPLQARADDEPAVDGQSCWAW
jgi:hypothetical protein